MNKEKIIVERKKRFSEARYSVGIYVDGEFVVNTIKSNTQEIELSSGKHILKVMQGNRSGEIEIDVKKGKVLTCAFSSTRLTYLLYFFLICTIVLSSRFFQHEITSLYASIPAILIAIYTFTIGRKTFFIFETPTEEDSWMTQ
jgi:hypothetical protein